jgi:hypothetical protein
MIKEKEKKSIAPGNEQQ